MGSLICRFAMLTLLVIALALHGAEAPREVDSQQILDVHRHQILSVNERFEDVFGPAPALASTPFLGLAAITGAALLVDQPFVANSQSPFLQRLRANALIRQAQSYASWWLFAVFLLLALSTAIVNSGKLHGSFGKFAHVVESIVVGVAYCGIAAGALLAGYPSPTVHVHAGMVTASIVPAVDLGAIALFVTAALALSAMIIVRLAFDLMIWLNPIPFIDLLFQGAKTGFSAVFLIVYLWSPWAAALLALLILVPCLLLLPWALRLLNFTRRIIIDPLLARVFPSFEAQLVDADLARSSGGAAATLALHACVLRARGLKKRQTVALVQIGNRTTLRRTRKGRGVRDLAAPQERVVIGRALAWIELRVLSPDGRVLDQIALPYSLLPHYGVICNLLSASDERHFGIMKALHTAGRAALQGADVAKHRSMSAWKSIR